MHPPQRTTRRRFLGTAAAATAAPLILPAGTLARPGRPGPNDRIVLGHIGLGMLGLLRLQGTAADRIGALCDVDAKRLAEGRREAVARGAKEPFACADYRRLLERSDIDAVIVATPDHWHAVQTIHAVEAGKDVYLEKSACRTVEEGWALIRAVRQAKRVVQVGAQSRSMPAAQRTARFIQGGGIGTVTKVDCFHYASPLGGTAPYSAPPPELDWDLWLGPLRPARYNPDCVHFNWRWLFDFGGGPIKDRGSHIMGLALYFTGRDDATLASVEARGETPPGGLWDCPTEMHVEFRFRNPDWTMTWSQPGEKIRGHPYGARYHGTSGTLEVGAGDGVGVDVGPEVPGERPPEADPQTPVREEHWDDWERCIRTREDPAMPVETGVAVALLGNLANLSFRLGRKLDWDAANRRCIGDEAANRLLGYPQRWPWGIAG